MGKCNVFSGGILENTSFPTIYLYHDFSLLLLHSKNGDEVTTT